VPAVSVSFSLGVPEIVGGVRFADGAGRTAVVGADAAEADPPAFDAVTIARTRKATSAAVRT
jgi:hypothetical protein